MEVEKLAVVGLGNGTKLQKYKNMSKTKRQDLVDFDIYTRAMLATNDEDPVYKVAKDIIRIYRFEPEWFVFVYVMFYNLETAIEICKKFPTKEKWSAKKFRKHRRDGGKWCNVKMGHERRGTQRQMENQILGLESAIRFINWYEELSIQADIQGTDPTDNAGFRKEIEKLYNHGSWSAFKIAELYEKSLGHKYLEILDMGLEGRNFMSNDGPVGGLRWIFDPKRDTEYQIDFNKDKTYWHKVWNRFGELLSKAYGIEGVGEVESCICKWHKTKSGKYWIGHDIAEFVELKEVLGKNYSVTMLKFPTELWSKLKHFPKENKSKYKNEKILLNKEWANNKYPRADIEKLVKKSKKWAKKN